MTQLPCLVTAIVLAMACRSDTPGSQAAAGARVAVPAHDDTTAALSAAIAFFVDSEHPGKTYAVSPIIVSYVSGAPPKEHSPARLAALRTAHPAIVAVTTEAAAKQACDTIPGEGPFCGYADFDVLVVAGTQSQTDTLAWVDLDYHYNVTMESLGAVDPALNAKVRGKHEIVLGVGSVCVRRDRSGRWHGVVYYETEFSDGPDRQPTPCTPRKALPPGK